MTTLLATLSGVAALAGIVIGLWANHIARQVGLDASATELRSLAREFLLTYAEYRSASLPLWMAVGETRERPSDDPVIIVCHRHLEVARTQASIIASWDSAGRSGNLAAGAEWLVTCMFAQHFALTVSDEPVDGSVASEWAWLLDSARLQVPWRASGTRALAQEWSSELADGRLDAGYPSANVAADALDAAARKFTDAVASALGADIALRQRPFPLRRPGRREPAPV